MALPSPGRPNEPGTSLPPGPAHLGRLQRLPEVHAAHQRSTKNQGLPPAVQSMLSEQGPPDTERAFWGQRWVSISGALPTIQGETEALGKEGQPGREEALTPVQCWPLRIQVSPSAAARRCWTGPRSHRSQAEPLGTSLGRGRPQNLGSEHEDQPEHLPCCISPHCRHSAAMQVHHGPCSQRKPAAGTPFLRLWATPSLWTKLRSPHPGL